MAVSTLADPRDRTTSTELAGATASVATPFSSLVGTIRWGALVIGLLDAAFRGPRTGHVLLWGALLVAFALARQLRPALYGRIGAAAIVGEAALAVVAVVSTGYWASPFVFTLLIPVMTAGFVRGFRYAARVALGSCLLVAVPGHLTTGGFSYDSLTVTGQWGTELLLVALLAGYSRRLFGEAERRHTLALKRMSKLTEANDLLVSLHRVAQTLPASLNLDQVLVSTVARIRSLIDCDLITLLVRDDATGSWLVGAAEGVSLGRTLADDRLPPALQAAARSSVASLVVTLSVGEGLGSDLGSRSGLYAPLRARGALVGLLALEHREPGHYGRQELRLVDGFVEPAALALDNARWFGRLRTMGADEERNRIARYMHDSVGQSLAYLGLKLDRITLLADSQPLREELGTLRTEVREVLGEVRDTLSDLRTDVSDERGLVETLDTFLARVGARADFEVSFRHDDTERLPLIQERELWRIAQEAVTNVERHAGATHMLVRWTSDGRSAHLTVADDGRGFDTTRNGRSDSFGITGMRERADAIDAKLTVESEPYVGTLVECRLAGRA